MQAITVAIGPAGIFTFAQKLLSGQMVTTLASGMAPPDTGFSVPDIQHRGDVVETWYQIGVSLTSGKTTGFAPAYSSVAQRSEGQFVMTFTAPAFGVNYAWSEHYKYEWCSPDNWGRNHCQPVEDKQASFGYGPAVGGLTATVTLGFVYDTPSNSYDFRVLGTTAQPSNVVANIPGGSIVQQEDPGCFSSHVSDATANAISSIPFGDMIGKVFPPLLKSIPASGKLTPDITYDFAVGDSAMSFPGDAGIAIGVTGTVKYKDHAYPGTASKALPVPPPPPAPTTSRFTCRTTSSMRCTGRTSRRGCSR
jgi:hypothetical protein